MSKHRVGFGAVAVLCAVTLFGCPPPGPELSVSDTFHNFGSTGEEFEFEVFNSGGTSSPLIFTVSVNKAWINVTPLNGQSDNATDREVITVTIDRDAKQAADDFNEATITVSSSVGQETIELVASPEYFTEEFDGDFDLDNTTVTFAEDESNAPQPALDFYVGSKSAAVDFPTDPSGGAAIDFSVADPFVVPLFNGAAVPFYGVDYDTLYIGSEGYIAFENPDKAAQILGGHFEVPRVSGLATDLNPEAGGMVSFRQTSEGVAVTYEDVSERNTINSNTFQIEVGFDGTINLTYLGVDASDSIVGLSFGGGVPIDFVETDLSEFNTATLKVAN